MLGGLGIGANINNWSDEEMEEAIQLVELYKQIRQVIMHGSLYRLESFKHSNMAAFQYVDKGGQEAVVFVLLHTQHFGSEERRLPLQGLEQNALYEVEDQVGATVRYHGSTLMNLGIPLTVRGDYSSRLIRLKRITS